jgi:hypothetical protein
MKLARWVFLIAGIFGLIPVVPLVYTTMVKGEAILPDFASMGSFFSVSVFQYVCWQISYIILARDPVRFRSMIILAFFVEITAPLNPLWLFLYGFRLWISIAVVDFLLAILFVVAFWLTGREPNGNAASVEVTHPGPLM